MGVKVTADDIAQLLANAPPRQVPSHVANATRVSGGWMQLLSGVGFFAFGMLFVRVFFPWQFYNDWRLADAPTTSGVVREVNDAHMKILGAKVMEYVFMYTPDGVAREGRCFTSGTRWSSGETVNVRYLKSNPGVACIDGARLSTGGPVGAFVVIFPSVGAGLVVASLVYWRRDRRLLRLGETAEAEVVSVEQTQTRVNNQSVYRVTLQAAELNGGLPVTVKRLNLADVDLATERLEAKQRLFVLYDPAKPKHLIFPETLISGDAR